MSFTENDRNFRSKSGKTFPNEPAYARFGPAIAEALRAEFGGSTSAIKSIGKLTGANERTVRNWFEGKNGPGGDNLIALIRHSDTVLRTMLVLSDRRQLALASDLRNLHSKMRHLMEALDELHVPE
jgi:hypothetical protein